MKLVVAGMENQRLSNLLHKSRQETHSLSVQLRSQQQSISYQPIVDSLRREIDAKDQKIGNLEAQIRSLTTDEGNPQLLRSQVNQLDAALSQSNQQVQQLQDQLAQLTLQHANSAANLQRVIQENNSLGSVLEEYKEMNKLLKQELETPQQSPSIAPAPAKIQISHQSTEPQPQEPSQQNQLPGEGTQQPHEQQNSWLSEKEALLSDLSRLQTNTQELERRLVARDSHIEFLEPKTHSKCGICIKLTY